MSKKEKKTGRRLVPDEHFSQGPFEFARFGRLIVQRSRLDADEVKAAQTELAARFPQVVAEIDALVQRIATTIARLPPDRLMHRAWWEFSTFAVGLGGKNLDDPDGVIATRMIDYVQSVIAAVEPQLPYASEPSDEEWSALRKDVGELFRKLTLDYQLCLSARNYLHDPNFNEGMEEFRHRAELFWLNVRGKRYQPHERQALLDVLEPHSEVLIRIFGIDAQALVGELEKILAKLTQGIGEVLDRYRQLHRTVIERMGSGQDSGLGSESPEAQARYEDLFRDPELAVLRERVIGEMFGLDLWDVERNTDLPPILLSELTWSPGGDSEFFAEGVFRGWPLRIWPIMKRPFIRINGQVCCFDLFGLFDNIYRVLQRAIFRLEPTYKDVWNARQNAVSESLPFTYLGRLLPGATVYRGIYYRHASPNGSLEWYEADGLVEYADHLFVVEVRGGSFTYTSPADDLPAHVASLQNLLTKPASQGSRFVDYMESAPEVTIADASHHEIARLRRSDFRHVTVCAVTLDAFTELAARAQHLRKVGLNLGSRPIWSLSIDDLRVLADLFHGNPLVFLHFAEQRIAAAQSELVDLDDELDHVGLYFAQNNYSQYASEIVDGRNDKVRFSGYRERIDRYYAAVVHGEQPKALRQDLPPRIAEILNFLTSSTATFRAEVCSFILDGSGEFRESINAAIEHSLKENIALKRSRPITTYGEMALTLCVWSPAAPRRPDEALHHVHAIVAGNTESSRPLLELEYSEQLKLRDVHWARVDLKHLSESELHRVEARGAALKKKRVNDVLRERKIRRNELCPCGSGRKYKRCCL